MRIVFVFLAVLLFAQPCFLGVAGAQPRPFVKFNQSPSGTLEIENQARAASRMWNRRALENSINLYHSAAVLWTKEIRPERAAACLREAARLHLAMGEEKKAATVLRDALKLLSGGQHPGEESQVYSELSLLALNAGGVDESRNYFEKALLLAGQEENPTARAAALYSAGEFYYFRDSTEEALKSYRESIELWRKADDASGEARSLLSLGYLYLKQSEYVLAFDVLNSALQKWRTSGDARGEALTLKAIGGVQNVMSRKQDSLDSLLKAEKMFPDDVDQAEKASLYNSIGYVYEDYGEWRLSLKYREMAYSQFQKTNHLYGQLATLPSLGKLSFLSGNDAAAVEYFKRAEVLARQLKDNFYAAIIALETGDFQFHKGEREKALGFYQAALKLFDPKTHRRFIARASIKLGQIHEIQNQTLLARRFYEVALAASREIKDNFAEAETLFHLARLGAAENKTNEALQSIEASIALTEHLTANILNSKVKATYFSNIYERYELYINLLMNLHNRFPAGGYDVRAFQASEKSRSRSMLETLLLADADFTKDADPQIASREREIRDALNLKSDELTNLLSNSADARRIEKASGEINELTTELEDVRAVLKQNSPFFSAVRNPSTIEVAEIQNRVLDDETVLAEFSFGREESFLWLVGKNQFASYRLPGRERIEKRVEKLRELLAAREMIRGETAETYQTRLLDAEREYEREARLLSDDLFGQIAEFIKGKRLIVVADGKLHYFPISALPVPDSDEPFLLNGETIYQPAASTLLLQVKSKRKPANGAQKNLAIFFDPVFSDRDERLSLEDRDDRSLSQLVSNSFRQTETLEFLQRLPASSDEAEAITDIVDSNQSAIFSGFSANRSNALSSNMSGYKIIHFATHGLIDEKRPELSGIVLSLFDEKGNRQEGLVRIQDIYSLDLSSDLVVLSACSTGIGKEVKGEGLQSLTNGFLQAGSKSVVSSLWKVDDYATRDLMKDFYRAMVEENVNASEALRRAQIKLRQNPQYQSPFYWAAFTVQGDYRRPPELARGFSYSLILSALLLTLLPLAGYGFYRMRRAKR